MHSLTQSHRSELNRRPLGERSDAVQRQASNPNDLEASPASSEGRADLESAPRSVREVSACPPRRRLTPDELIEACRVPDSVPEGRAGLWSIRRSRVDDLSNPFAQAYVRHLLGGFDSYTLLERDTMATLHRERGECVMEDSLRELQRHLPILVAARGRVLISGLGLGCVVRGLLAKPEVEHVDVIEIDHAIAQLVWPEFAANERVTLHMGDAESISWSPGSRWDFAWHDVWSETESLDLVHGRILARYHDLVGQQGAWQFNRAVKRRWPRLLNAKRRVRA
jgi:hypothetical protein